MSENKVKIDDLLDLDEQSAIYLGLHKNHPIPDRKREIKASLPISPMATWNIHKHVADYVGLIPAVLISELVSWHQLFVDIHRLPDDHPFIVSDIDIQRFADSIGISEELIVTLINNLLKENFLSMVHVHRISSSVKSKDARRLEANHNWFTINYELMDQKFFEE